MKKDAARSLKTRNIAHPTPDLSRLNIKPCISREFVAVLDVTMERRCIQYKRRSKGAALGLTGPDVTLRPFGALVHIDWLEMKSGSKAHRIAARALLITDQETEFLGVLPSKRKLASVVIRALHDFDDPGSPGDPSTHFRSSS